MGPDRLALERTGPHPRQPALVGGDTKMVGPERHQPLGKSAIGNGGALQPRQRLAAEGFLDDVQLLRRLRRRGVRLHRFGRGHRRIGVGLFRRVHRLRFSGNIRLSGNIHGDIVKREISPLRLGVRGGRRRRRVRRRQRSAGFRGGIAGLLDLELIGEHHLSQRRRRQQAGHFEQHATGAAQFGFDKAARIGGGIEQIARRAAARAKAEAIERDKTGLRIAGHRISLVRRGGVYWL